MLRHRIVLCAGLLAQLGLSGLGGLTQAYADSPLLTLGPKPSFGLFQPRVTGEILTSEGQSLGPTSSSFLLDTGASGVLVYPPATGQLATNGFQNEGEPYEEAGLSGTSFFDVSAPYTLRFTGTGGSEEITDIRFLSGAAPPDPTGLMGLNGIVGMPALDGRVTSMDNRTREGALSLSMGVLFSDELPATDTHRFTVPLTELAFPAEGDGPLPTFESLSTLDVISQNGDMETRDPIVLDSGAQVTIINTAIANRLGLDVNGNGDFLDEAVSTVPLSGATGTIDAPVLQVDEMRIPTDQGFELVWTDAEVVVFDIHPRIQGVLGADFMSGDGGLDFSLLGGGDSGLGDLSGLLGELGLGDLFGEGFGDIFSLLGLENLGDLGGIDLEGLGIDLSLLGLAGGDLFASFPLESYFDQVHFDFREFPENGGQLVFDLNPTISSEILNGDHVFDVNDIDDLSARIGQSSANFDLNGDGTVTVDDHTMLVQSVFGTRAGDTDLDGDVDFADFLQLSGEFGTSQASWADGDFDGNGQVEFSDFLALSGNFGATVGGTESVPEPNSGYLTMIVGMMLFGWRKRRQ